MTSKACIVLTSSIETILVRAYEDRTDLLRSLIIGPENTPYADAPFVIDWMLDSDFPNSPPKAHFLSWTNGNGRGMQSTSFLHYSKSVLICGSEPVSALIVSLILGLNNTSAIYTKKEKSASRCWEHGKEKSMKYGAHSGLLFYKQWSLFRVWSL